MFTIEQFWSLVRSLLQTAGATAGFAVYPGLFVLDAMNIVAATPFSMTFSLSVGSPAR